MSTTYKPLGPNDKISTKTLLHEAIPITGTILSGTYMDRNIKSYSHGMFHSVYDYPYLSSSANHIFDVTFGYSKNSPFSASAQGVNGQRSKKVNIYNQMAQVLNGYDKDGSIKEFDEDGDYSGGNKLRECIFLSFSRLLVKDEIKKGSFNMTLGISGSDGAPTTTLHPFGILGNVKDTGASTSYKINSPTGEYGILYLSGTNAANSLKYLNASKISSTGNGIPCGLIYYQAGVAVLTSSIFLEDTKKGFLKTGATGVTNALTNNTFNFGGIVDGKSGIDAHFTGSTIDTMATYLRARIQNISFNNTVELNSTIYFCRANHNEFNYSSNPTYLTSSQIRVKQETTDLPVSYVTTVGLYSADNQLLAVGKLSEPLRKDPTIEYTLRARLDY
jgi:hypothetical protein